MNYYDPLKEEPEQKNYWPGLGVTAAALALGGGAGYKIAQKMGKKADVTPPPASRQSMENPLGTETPQVVPTKQVPVVQPPSPAFHKSFSDALRNMRYAKDPTIHGDLIEELMQRAETLRGTASWAPPKGFDADFDALGLKTGMQGEEATNAVNAVLAAVNKHGVTFSDAPYRFTLKPEHLENVPGGGFRQFGLVEPGQEVDVLSMPVYHNGLPLDWGRVTRVREKPVAPIPPPTKVPPDFRYFNPK